MKFSEENCLFYERHRGPEAEQGQADMSHFLLHLVHILTDHTGKLIAHIISEDSSLSYLAKLYLLNFRILDRMCPSCNSIIFEFSELPFPCLCNGTNNLYGAFMCPWSHGSQSWETVSKSYGIWGRFR